MSAAEQVNQQMPSQNVFFILFTFRKLLINVWWVIVSKFEWTLLPGKYQLVSQINIYSVMLSLYDNIYCVYILLYSNQDDIIFSSCVENMRENILRKKINKQELDFVI